MTETYKQVRSIKRGLDVLAALNSRPNASVAEISQQTGVHRTTVYRILETLQALGYVRQNLSNESYRATHKVRRLCSSIDERTRIADAAAPRLDELLREVVWPSSVAFRGDDAMVIEETTHGRSPLFVHHVAVGTRSPVLSTAMGRAYLAYCDEAEREIALAALARSESRESRIARDPSYVERVIETTRSQGYGFSFGDTELRLGSVALPIRIEGVAVGCVNVVFLTKAVARESAAKTYLPPLQRAVDAIERDLRLS
jgi:IclR family mhp operon transcriptional activator